MWHDQPGSGLNKTPQRISQDKFTSSELILNQEDITDHIKGEGYNLRRPRANTLHILCFIMYQAKQHILLQNAPPFQFYMFPIDIELYNNNYKLVKAKNFLHTGMLRNIEALNREN